jgi:hypothetical protein
MQQPPIFDGFDPIGRPVQTFIKEMERYFVINNIADARWPFILDTLVEDPALMAYEAAKNGHGIRADQDLAAMAAGAAANELRARYTAR